MAEQNKARINKPTEQAQAGDPGYGLGLAGFIVSFFVSIAGLIMSVVALNQSKAAGKRNGFAFAGMIIGIVKTAIEALAIVGLIIGSVFLINYCSHNAAECRNDSGYDNGRYYHMGQEPSTETPDKTY